MAVILLLAKANGSRQGCTRGAAPAGPYRNTPGNRRIVPGRHTALQGWVLRSVAVFVRQRFDEIDDLPANLRIADLDEGAVELDAFGSVQEIDDIGRRAVLGKSGRLTTFLIRSPVEEEG